MTLLTNLRCWVVEEKTKTFNISRILPLQPAQHAMKFKLDLNTSALNSSKPVLVLGGTLLQRKELKKFKLGQKQPASFDAQDLSQTKLALTKQLNFLAISLQCLDYNIKLFEDILNAALDGGFKERNSCQIYVVKVLRETRHDTVDTYALVLRYLTSLRAFSGDENVYSKLLMNQAKLLDSILQVLMRDSYTAQFVLQAIDLEKDSISALFRKAYVLVDESTALDTILNSWFVSGILEQSQQHQKSVTLNFKELFMIERGNSSSDDHDFSYVRPSSSLPAMLGNPNFNSDEQPAAAMIPVIYQAAVEAAHAPIRLNPNIFPPPLDTSSVKELSLPPELYTTELDSVINEFYQGLEWSGPAFHEKNTTPPEEKWTYEGWTLEFSNYLEAQEKQLNERFK